MGNMKHCYCQRWCPRGRPKPRGHILKSLALASTVRFSALASKPTSPQKCPVLGSRTAQFFDLLKMDHCHDFTLERNLAENLQISFCFVF